jgi:outer membrane protein assembly factor BamE (lipoprotein component of BamABCDE complex)
MKRYLIIVCFIFAASLSSCVDNINLHGTKLKAQDLDKVKTGISKKNDVFKAIGAASIESENIWYYIYFKKNSVGFLKPELIEQEIIEIEFADNDKVQNIKHYSKDDAIKVAYVKRITPEEEKRVSIFRQILGNAGRFGE